MIEDSFNTCIEDDLFYMTCDVFIVVFVVTVVVITLVVTLVDVVVVVTIKHLYKQEIASYMEMEIVLYLLCYLFFSFVFFIS